MHLTTFEALNRGEVVKSWLQYARQFARVARAADYSDADIERILAYARPLFQAGFPIIYTQDHFARLVGYDVDFLRGASNRPKKFYRSFCIPKSSGGVRQILEPLPSLKEVQRWLLDNIFQKIEVSRYAKAYVVGQWVGDNARFHRRQEIVVRLDLRDFFGSVRFKSVYSIVRSLGYARPVSTMIAALCTYDGSLPQGAPTSPTIANLATRRLDYRIAAYCRSRRIRFTRYADDMSFSGTFSVGELIGMVDRVVRSEGLSLNTEKTMVMRSHQKQLVTGIVVNHHLQVPREKRRDLRKAIHYIERFGFDGHVQAIGETRRNYLAHLRGVAAFILQVNPSDRDARHAIDVLSHVD